MPNHVMNILRFTGEESRVQAMRKAIETPERPGSIDFQKILPIPPDIFMGDLGQKDMELYGTNNWYDWCRGNWGTKWNAYDIPDDPLEDGSLNFCTAWSAPHPVMQKLSELFPDITIWHQWADEDIGYNCGERTYKGGKVLDEYYPDYGKRAVDFALDVFDATPEDYSLVLNADGTDYAYQEELDEMEEMHL